MINSTKKVSLQAFNIPMLLWVAVLVSILARVASSLYLGNHITELPGIADQNSYHTLALRVLNGYGFSFAQTWWPLTAPDAPTAHWSFLYTFYLVIVYGLFGPNPIAARLIQAVFTGLIQPILIYQLARTVFNQRAAILSAFALAGYTYFIYYAGALMTEPFYITTILASFWVALKITKTPQEKNSILLGYSLLLGLLLGFTVLLRQLFLLFTPFLVGWILYARWKEQSAVNWLPVIVPILVILGMILPFSWYNYVRFDQFVLLNTNSGFAFFWGNHPIYGTHFVSILTPEMGSYEALIPVELRSLSEAAMEKELLKLGLGFVFQDPVRYIQLSISRIPPYFMFWPSSESGLFSNLSRVLGFGLYLPFMLFGLYLAVKNDWKHILHTFSGLALLFFFVYAGVHILTWTLIRYRLPIDAVYMVFVGVALDKLFSLRNVWGTGNLVRNKIQGRHANSVH